MNQEIKKQWLAALRSGQYEQGREALCRVDDDGTKAYCCLGVLCDLHSQVTGTEWQQPAIPSDPDLVYLGVSPLLPTEVAEWAGLPFKPDSHSTPAGRKPDRYTDVHVLVEPTQGQWEDADYEPYENTLSQLNDDGHSFEEIAKIIEENFTEEVPNASNAAAVA